MDILPRGMLLGGRDRQPEFVVLFQLSWKSGSIAAILDNIIISKNDIDHAEAKGQ